MTSDARIKANIVARDEARNAVELLEEEAQRHAEPIRFWGELIKLIREHLPGLIPDVEVMQDRPMGDEEAEAFERESMKFGKHQDTQIGEVPIDYLVWMEEQDDFRRELNRYLRSERGQQRQEEIK